MSKGAEARARGREQDRRRRAGTAIVATLGVAAAALGAVAVHKSQEEAPSCVPSEQLISFVGDSYTNGAGTDSGAAHRFPALVAAQFGAQKQVLGFNGSGYVARGPKPYNVTFPEAAARVNPTAKVVVVLGSRNDTAPRSEVESAAKKTFATVREVAPHARIVVFGPPWINGLPTDQIKSDREAVKAAAKSADVEFHDPLADGWFAERSKIRDGKSTMIASDHIHPNDAGHAYIADRIASALVPALCRVRS